MKSLRLLVFLLSAHAAFAQGPNWKGFQSGREANYTLNPNCSVTNPYWTGNVYNHCIDDYSVQETYSALFNTNVTKILHDHLGNTWLATYRDGVAKFDGTRWQVFNSWNSPLGVGDYIRDLYTDSRGATWISTEAEVFKLEGTTWTAFDSAPFIPKGYIAEDSDGNMWFSGNGLIKFDGTNWTAYNTTNSPLISNFLDRIAIDANDVIWVAYFTGSFRGFYRFDGTNWELFDHTVSPLLSTRINAFVPDGNGGVWMATSDKGVVNFDGDSTWTSYTETNSDIPDNDVLSLLFDNSGNMWAGTRDGLGKFDGANWQIFNFQNTPWRYQAIYTLAMDQNDDIWIGGADISDSGRHGVYKYNGTWQELVPSPTTLPVTYFSTVYCDSRGNTWIGTNGRGIVKYDGANYTGYESYTGSSVLGEVNSITEDTAGNIWFTTSLEDLYMFNGSTFQKYDMDNVISPENGISDVEVDNNNVKWIAIWKSGLVRFTGASIQVFTPNNSPIPDEFVNELAIDSVGTIWMATEGGLLSYNGSTWATYTEANSPLTDDRIKRVVFDSKQHLWMSTSGGGVYKIENGRWKRYGADNSPLASDYANGLAADDNGTVWIGSPGSAIQKFNGHVLEPHVKAPLPSNGGPLSTDTSGILWITGTWGMQVYYDNLNTESKTLLTGNVFHDLDSNGIFGASDHGLNGQGVLLLPDSVIAYTSFDGSYYFEVVPGNYSVTYLNDSAWALTSDSVSFHVMVDSVDTGNYDFGVTGIGTNKNISVDIIVTGTRCNSSQTLWLTYQNQGVTSVSGNLSLSLDTSITVTQLTPAPDSAQGSTYYWSYSNLMPSEVDQFSLYIQLPGITSVNDSMLYTAQVDSRDGTGNILVTRTDTLRMPLTCGFDPNDKLLEQHDVLNPEFVRDDEPLIFTVNFQNTGNDTAFNIVVRDTLDAYLDLSTFEFIGGSHETQTFLDIHNGTVSFHVENALLPDSFTNEPASKGYVRFSLLPVSGVNIGTVIRNQASIYFDFNPPIHTNTVQATVFDCDSIAQFSIINQQPAYCENAIVNLQYTGFGAVALNWEVNGSFRDTTSDFSYTAVDTGNIVIRLAASNPVCTNTSAKQAYVTAHPSPVYALDNDTVLCNGETLKITSAASTGNQWYLDGTPLTDSTARTLNVAASGIYQLQWTLNTCTGISDSISVAFILPPAANMSLNGSDTICAGESVTLTSDSSSGNSWLLNGSVIGGSTAQTLDAANEGYYQLRVTNLACDDLSDSVFIKVRALPVAEITAGGALEFCAGDSVLLNTDEANGTTWFHDGAAIVSGTAQLKVTQSGIYSLQVADDYCAVMSDSLSVDVHLLPVVSLGDDDTIFTTGSVELQFATGYSYQWSTGSDENSITVHGSIGTGTYNYTLTVTDANGCTASDSVHITVTEPTGIGVAASVPFIQIIPNPFSDFTLVRLHNFNSGAQMLHVHDLAGRELLSRELKSAEIRIDRNHLPAGVYFLVIKGESEILKEKLVIW